MFESSKTIIGEPIEIKREFTKINYNSYMDLYNVMKNSRKTPDFSHGDIRLNNLWQVFLI